MLFTAVRTAILDGLTRQYPASCVVGDKLPIPCRDSWVRPDREPKRLRVVCMFARIYRLAFRLVGTNSLQFGANEGLGNLLAVVQLILCNPREKHRDFDRRSNRVLRICFLSAIDLANSR